MLGEARTGVQEQMLEDAVADATGQPMDVLPRGFLPSGRPGLGRGGGLVGPRGDAP